MISVNDVTGKRHGRRIGSRAERLKGCQYPDIICDSDCSNWAICRALRAERSALVSKYRLVRQQYAELASRFEARTPCDFCRYDSMPPDERPCREYPAEARGG